ncbi:phosphodiesterase [Jannaschia sp. S6380]|uniref:glycerophosphodiester phosphodiesterase family protein n=1 Tax=Jannaschia sp. S6380 TaxID=2926408 RepID=UPI001FF5D7D7|nr:glycerophosphodiester phosphodiesterase family protein [Jannaschia sp. S6380]MCK0168826.1 phosphodiesterase [Jannaschia sp. S6380]
MTLPASFLTGGHIAHRGLHGPGRPENSMDAFRAALDLGIPIELDVQPSADGVAMAFHDNHMRRLTGLDLLVDSLDADALGGTALRGGNGGVPRLSQVLDLVAGRVPLLIEVKDRDGAMGPDVGPLEAAVIADLARYDGDVAVMSFNPHAVACFQRDAPHLPRGLVTAAFRAEHWPDLSAETRARLARIPDIDRLGASFISHEAAALDMPRVAEIKATGLPILCWTVRSRAEELRARRVADAVTFEGYLP